MNFKVKKVKVSDITNPSHHKTNMGGPISIGKKKIKVPKISTSTNLTRAGLSKFKNLMRYLKDK